MRLGRGRARFADRQDAGTALADRLARAGLSPGTVVLAVPRGGVPVAAIVAERLGLLLDVLVAHKIGAPGNPELAIGAVTADGTMVIEPWAREFGLSRTDLESAIAGEIGRAREREAHLRGGRASAPLAGRVAVVVDDGIATGATVEAAVLAARTAGAIRVIVAVPVGAPDSLQRLRHVADEVISLLAPEAFRAVGEWYDWFPQVSDAEVTELLAEAGRRAEAVGGPAGGGPGAGHPHMPRDANRRPRGDVRS